MDKLEKAKEVIRDLSENNYAKLKRSLGVGLYLFNLLKDNVENSYLDLLKDFDRLPIEKRIGILKILEERLKSPTPSFDIDFSNIEKKPLTAFFKPVEELKVLEEKEKKILKAFGIKDLYSALYFVPLRYEDRRLSNSIKTTRSGQKVALKVRVIDTGFDPQEKYPAWVECEDGTGKLFLRFKYKDKRALYGFRKGQEIIVYGKLKEYKGEKYMVHPELLKDAEAGKIIPFYYIRTDGELKSISAKRRHEILRRTLTKLSEYAKYMPEYLPSKLLDDERFKEYRENIRKIFGKDVHEVIKDERYAMAHGLYKEVVHRKLFTSRDITDSIDKVLLHPFLGVPLFLFIMFLVFKISFDFSSPFMDWIEGFINGFIAPFAAEVLTYLGAGELMKRVVSEALIGGVGFVLTFVPLIAVIYFMLSLLEFSGYLPRIAFLMDRFMHRLGLHGKSLVPLLLGFGCNVPAIVATRTLETKRDKLLVIAMIPFMSCPARLVVFSFFAVLFFKNPAIIIFSLYLLGILVALITALFLRKTAFKGGLYHFVMELPPYRLPTLRLLFRVVWVYVKDFLYRAGTLIFAASVVIWLLLNLPPGVKNPSESIAGYIGRTISPIFAPLGLDDWRMSTSLIPAFLAREIVLSSMATIYTAEASQETKEDFELLKALKEQVYALGNAFKEAFLNVFKPVPTAFEVKEEDSQSLRSIVAKSLSPASALAFMVFLLLYTSCLGTVATMWREVGKGFALLFFAYSLLIGWFLGFLAYRLGSLLWST